MFKKFSKFYIPVPYYEMHTRITPGCDSIDTCTSFSRKNTYHVCLLLACFLLADKNRVPIIGFRDKLLLIEVWTSNVASAPLLIVMRNSIRTKLQILRSTQRSMFCYQWWLSVIVQILRQILCPLHYFPLLIHPQVVAPRGPSRGRSYSRICMYGFRQTCTLSTTRFMSNLRIYDIINRHPALKQQILYFETRKCSWLLLT